MIRIKDIQEAFFDVVGWEQTLNPLKTIERDLTKTESGLYFQSAHPLLTLENIESIMPENYVAKFPEWDEERFYEKNMLVQYLGQPFIAQEDVEGITPDAKDFNNDYDMRDFGGPWRQYNALSDFLRVETNNAIATTIQRFQTGKTLEQGSNRVLQKDTFYPTEQHDMHPLTSKNHKVGFEIKQTRSVGVSTRVNKIGLRFTAPCTVAVTLQHTAKTTPTRVEILEYALENGETQWFDINDLFLAGEEESYGAWRLTYDQRALPEGVKGVGPAPRCCTKGSKFISVKPISIGEKVDFESRIGGINADVTIGCDITDFLIRQRMAFATVLQLQVATTFLRAMAMNPNVRINANQSNISRLDILYELDGNTAGYRPGGLGNALKQAYEEIAIDTTGIDSFCLPCRRSGVKYRTV